MGHAESAVPEHAGSRATERATGHAAGHETGHAQELWCGPRRRTWPDATGREMLIGCGAAVFGLRLAVRSLGYEPEVSLLPDAARPRLLASVRPGRAVPVNA
jgi:hypothetical protein